MSRPPREGRVRGPPQPSVVDDDLERACKYAKPGKANTQGDVDAAFKAAKAISDTEVGCSIITHCCMESHWLRPSRCEDGTSLTAWCSTQAISGKNGDFAQEAGSPTPRRRHAICQHMGGGFGSKFGIDAWARGRPGCRRGPSGR